MNDKSPPTPVSPRRTRTIAVNTILLALCVYLGASLFVLSNGRLLVGISPYLARTAYYVLLTPLSPVWYYASLPDFRGRSAPSTPSAPAVAKTPDKVANADERVAELSASRQIDDAGRSRMREEIASARQAYEQLAAGGRHREAAIALSPGIAAASRLDDLDSLEELVDLQVEALKKGPAQ